MTSTSFGTQTPGLPQSLLAPSCENSIRCQHFGAQSQGVPGEDGAEVQRVKHFSGQYTFKAPAADDFAKGMLPSRVLATPVATVEAAVGTTAGLIKAIKTFLGVSRSGGLSSRESD